MNLIYRFLFLIIISREKTKTLSLFSYYELRYFYYVITYYVFFIYKSFKTSTIITWLLITMIFRRLIKFPSKLSVNSLVWNYIQTSMCINIFVKNCYFYRWINLAVTLNLLFSLEWRRIPNVLRKYLLIETVIFCIL